MWQMLKTFGILFATIITSALIFRVLLKYRTSIGKESLGGGTQVSCAGWNLVSCSLLYPVCEIKSVVYCHISQLGSDLWPPAVFLPTHLPGPLSPPSHWLLPLLIFLTGWAPSELKSTSQLHSDLWPPCLTSPAFQSGHNLTCHSLTSLPSLCSDTQAFCICPAHSSLSATFQQCCSTHLYGEYPAEADVKKTGLGAL